MGKGHFFNFIGGDILSKMGASWFVSYSYYLHVDKKHENWNKCETVAMRQSFLKTLSTTTIIGLKKF